MFGFNKNNSPHQRLHDLSLRSKSLLHAIFERKITSEEFLKEGYALLNDLETLQKTHWALFHDELQDIQLTVSMEMIRQKAKVTFDDSEGNNDGQF